MPEGAFAATVSFVLASFAERLDASLSGQLADTTESGFVALDARVRRADARGVLRVRAPAGLLDAVSSHVERRCRALGRRVVVADARAESAWRDVAARFGAGALPTESEAASEMLASAASRARAVVLVPGSAFGAWDQAVLHSLTEREGEALFVLLLAEHAELPSTLELIEVSEELDPAALGCWWDAVATAHAGKLSELDGWLGAASRSERRAPEAVLAELPESSRGLFERLTLAGRAWPAAALEALGGEPGDFPRLLSAGLAELRDGFVSVRPMAPEAPSPVNLEWVARSLAQAFPQDAWALARSAELWGSLGKLAPLEQAMRAALGLVDDGVSRAELWSRFAAALDACPADGVALARLAGAELALDLGDADVGLEWAHRAGSVEPRARAALVLGRAALARGDLVSALAALERARDLLVADDDARGGASVQIAEVRYAMGELAEAAKLAGSVLASARTPSLRLAARNLLGKLLLANGDWAAADAHFAADECEAIGAGDLTAELRARVNRAIALLSRGASEPARAMLTAVLRDAEARGERRAVGFALSNLAVLAIERHDYGHALELLERTIGAHRRLGDRLNFARDVSNLVELRLRLGLVEQAEQALRFGRNALGPGAPGSRAAELALASAQVHLCRGRTPEAEREVRAALRSASMSSDGDKLGECHRLAARIALEDGAVPRAQAELERARALAKSPFDHAEIALLSATTSRALGSPERALADHAVAMTREAGDEELAREAHVLAAEIALDQGEASTALSHLLSARSLTDDVVRSLSGQIRSAYLARPQLQKLARLERITLESPEADVEPVSLRPASEPPRTSRGATVYVGRHPSVRSLLDSISKVGRTGATVLVHGESGTGKELVSELIHAQSGRAQGPLVKVNCSALVETLLLSELFGHEKGAFTGASSRRRGRFERANGGTLFLDEIGDISPRTQVALLRVLEERRIERVGGSAPIEVDVRIVCATHRDLRGMVERGEFREDLYYRLSGITLEVPALRDRASDLPVLCDAILERIATERAEPQKRLSREALELLARHRWPGNVRELENALRAVSVLSDGELIEAHDFIEHVEALRKLSAEPVSSRREPSSAARHVAVVPDVAAGGPVTDVAYREIRMGAVSLSDLKRNIERDCIERALEDAGGNITRAAALLGMKRPRLSQLVKQYGFLVNGAEDPS